MSNDIDKFVKDNIFLTNNYNHLLFSKILKLIVDSEIYLNNAPSHEKFSLCQSIRTKSDNLHDYAFDYLFSSPKDKKKTITQLNKAHSKLKFKWQVFYLKGYFKYEKGRLSSKPNLELIELRKSNNVSKLLSEVGKLIGYEISKLNSKDKES